MSTTAEANAVVVFADDLKISVRETPSEVEHAIAAVTTPHVPLAELHDALGEPVKVNAAQICYVTPYAGRKGARAVGF
jgi:Protein of unknown function (DUF3107)